MLIGIEHEVGVLDQQRSLQKALGVIRPSEQYNVYRPVTDELSVAYDKEYYPTQYEVKFRGFSPTVENIAKVSDYFGELYGKTDTIQNKGPDFVGTHIHLFDNYGPNNKGLLQVVERVFGEMAGFWKTYYEDDRIAHIYKLYELKRLSTSNNLLKFLDHNVFNGMLRNILDLQCQQYQYRDIGYDRPKYSPVIWSPERGGKAYSLELRYISNTYFLLEDPVKIQRLIQDCSDIVQNTTVNAPSLDFYKVLVQKIFQHYLTITTLSYGIQNNLSLLNVEERIRKQLSSVTITFTGDELRFISQVDLNLISDSDIFARNNRRRDDSQSNSGNDGDDWGDDTFGDDQSDEEESS